MVDRSTRSFPSQRHNPNPSQILTFVLLIMLSFSGFLVTRIPVYFKWISKISYLTCVLD